MEAAGGVGAGDDPEQGLVVGNRPPPETLARVGGSRDLDLASVLVAHLSTDAGKCRWKISVPIASALLKFDFRKVLLRMWGIIVDHSIVSTILPVQSG